MDDEASNDDEIDERTRSKTVIKDHYGVTDDDRGPIRLTLLIKINNRPKRMLETKEA